MSTAIKLPELSKDERKYLDRLREAEKNPDLSLQFGPGSDNREPQKRKRIAQKKLVFLSYAQNNCYTILSEQASDGVQIDPIGGTWMYEGKTYKIGEQQRQCDWGSRYGPIGVYDRTNIQSLNSMLRDARDAVRSRSTTLDD